MVVVLCAADGCENSTQTGAQDIAPLRVCRVLRLQSSGKWGGKEMDRKPAVGNLGVHLCEFGEHQSKQKASSQIVSSPRSTRRHLHPSIWKNVLLKTVGVQQGRIIGWFGVGGSNVRNQADSHNIPPSSIIGIFISLPAQSSDIRIKTELACQI